MIPCSILIKNQGTLYSGFLPSDWSKLSMLLEKTKRVVAIDHSPEGSLFIEGGENIPVASFDGVAIFGKNLMIDEDSFIESHVDMWLDVLSDDKPRNREHLIQMRDALSANHQVVVRDAVSQKMGKDIERCKDFLEVFSNESIFEFAMGHHHFNTALDLVVSGQIDLNSGIGKEKFLEVCSVNNVSYLSEFIAAKGSHLDQSLLDEGLTLAAWNGHRGIVSRLLPCGANPNAENGRLMIAAAVNDSYDIATSLLQHGYDVFQSVEESSIALDISFAGRVCESEEDLPAISIELLGEGAKPSSRVKGILERIGASDRARPHAEFEILRIHLKLLRDAFSDFYSPRDLVNYLETGWGMIREVLFIPENHDGAYDLSKMGTWQDLIDYPMIKADPIAIAKIEIETSSDEWEPLAYPLEEAREIYMEYGDSIPEEKWKEIVKSYRADFDGILQEIVKSAVNESEHKGTTR